MDDDAIKEGARKIAAALRSPAGQIKLARVIGAHLDWFALVQRRGLSWDQTIRILADAGATRENGVPFSRGHLSSAVWRARQGQPQEFAAPPRASARPALQPPVPVFQPAPEAFRSDKGAWDSRPGTSAPTGKEDLRDYMRKAADARRRAQES